jgi:hypothetical protein
MRRSIPPRVTGLCSAFYYILVLMDSHEFARGSGTRDMTLVATVSLENAETLGSIRPVY